MMFRCTFVPSADGDLAYYKAREQRMILDAVRRFLDVDADVESKRRKRLRPNPLAPWELRAGQYRVFYENPGRRARAAVLAVGHKVHNDLFIRGRRVEL